MAAYRQGDQQVDRTPHRAGRGHAWVARSVGVRRASHAHRPPGGSSVLPTYGQRVLGSGRVGYRHDRSSRSSARSRRNGSCSSGTRFSSTSTSTAGTTATGAHHPGGSTPSGRPPPEGIHPSGRARPQPTGRPVIGRQGRRHGYPRSEVVVCRPSRGWCHIPGDDSPPTPRWCRPFRNCCRSDGVTAPSSCRGRAKSPRVRTPVS